MKKQPIGILDGGFEGINIFDNLSKSFPYETFVYINDPVNYPYEGKEEELIHKHVTKNIDKLLSMDVKCIVCVNASIIEYCEDLLHNINVPTILIVDSIIDYVNLNFEQKNMAILGKEYILKANLFVWKEGVSLENNIHCIMFLMLLLSEIHGEEFPYFTACVHVVQRP